MAKAKNRDEFSPKSKQVIAARVAYHCSHPECQAQTVGPNSETDKGYNVGAACHIEAAAENGPRYNRDMTKEQRVHPDNGIWMCRTHADEIDDDESEFTVDLLRTWKREAEQRARRMLGKAVRVDTRPVHFADVSAPERYGLQTVVELEGGSKIPLADTFDIDTADLTFFANAAFTLRFLVAKSEHVKSIMLYELTATVYEYSPLPEKYRKFQYALPQMVFPYLLELDKPIDGKPRPCSAKWYCPPDSEKPVPFTPLHISENFPQVIDVRFTAPTSGIYTFSLDAVIANGVDRHTFRILNHYPVMFEKFEEVHPELAGDSDNDVMSMKMMWNKSEEKATDKPPPQEPPATPSQE